MNCRRIQEIIPLFVGGDLERKREELVSAHLRSCPACSSVADQYNESVEWLQSYRPPEFAAAFYDDLKQGVLAQVKREELRPSFFQAVFGYGKWNAVFATVALLVIIGSLVFYANRRGLIGNSDKKQTAIVLDQVEPTKPNLGRVDSSIPERRPKIAGKRHRQSRTTPKDAIAVAEKPIEPELSPELAVISQNVVSESDVMTLAENLPFEENPVTTDTRTRIDLQTSDPNIRIIWFIPTEPTKALK